MSTWRPHEVEPMMPLAKARAKAAAPVYAASVQGAVLWFSKTKDMINKLKDQTIRESWKASFAQLETLVTQSKKRQIRLGKDGKRFKIVQVPESVYSMFRNLHSGSIPKPFLCKQQNGRWVSAD